MVQVVGAVGSKYWYEGCGFKSHPGLTLLGKDFTFKRTIDTVIKVELVGLWLRLGNCNCHSLICFLPDIFYRLRFAWLCRRGSVYKIWHLWATWRKQAILCHTLLQQSKSWWFSWRFFFGSTHNRSIRNCCCKSEFLRFAWKFFGNKSYFVAPGNMDVCM